MEFQFALKGLALRLFISQAAWASSAPHCRSHQICCFHRNSNLKRVVSFSGSWFICSSSSNSATAYQMALTLYTPQPVILSHLLAVSYSKKKCHISKWKLSSILMVLIVCHLDTFFYTSACNFNFFKIKIIFWLVSLIVATHVGYIMQYEKRTLLVKYPIKSIISHHRTTADMCARQWKKTDVVPWRTVSVRGVALHDTRRRWDDTGTGAIVDALQCGRL